MILNAANVHFAYCPSRAVLRGVSLEVHPGRVTALFGPNGCGKSTLLRCMNGALRPQSGQITLDGRQIDTMQLGEIARQIAVVPQDTPADMPFSVAEMVLLGRYARGNLWGDVSPEDRKVVSQCLERVDALDLAARPFSQLSGGERQRVIIARALAQQGQVLLLDEPAAHLDIAHQLELYRLVRQLAGEGHAILMVCHDILIAPMFVDEAVLMSAGSALAAGPAERVLTTENLTTALGVAAQIHWGEARSLVATFGDCLTVGKLA